MRERFATPPQSPPPPPPCPCMMTSGRSIRRLVSEVRCHSSTRRTEFGIGNFRTVSENRERSQTSLVLSNLSRRPRSVSGLLWVFARHFHPLRMNLKICIRITQRTEGMRTTEGWRAREHPRTHGTHCRGERKGNGPFKAPC